MIYIVWVGGSIVYEDIDKNIANYIAESYSDEGYDDVVIEEPQHYLHDGTLYGDASIVSID